MSASTGCCEDAVTCRAAGGAAHRRSGPLRRRPARGEGAWRRLLVAEEGQTLLLGIGLMAVVIALVLTVASVTAIYLDVKRLTFAADSAAAAAARSVSSDTYYQGDVSAPGSDSVPGLLTDAAVRDVAVEDVAAQVGLVDLECVQVAQAYAEGGDTAVVTLTACSRPPFLPWGILPSEDFTITATSTARVTAGP